MLIHHSSREVTSTSSRDLGRTLHVPPRCSVDPLSITIACSSPNLGADPPVLDRLHARRDFRKFFLYLNLFVSRCCCSSWRTTWYSPSSLEGVGLCSYWLVSYYFDRDSAARGKKAFITTAGDVGMLIACSCCSRDSHVDLPHHLRALRHADADDRDPGRAGLLLPDGQAPRSPSSTGCPTPWRSHAVSALIHAATMVTAGVYLLVRMSPVSPVALGSHDHRRHRGVTAFVAATIATSQKDIKKVLAFSTISQIATWCSPSAWAPTGRDLLDDRSRVLQSAALPRFGFGHPFAQWRAGHAQDGRSVRSTTLTSEFLIGWLAISGIRVRRFLVQGRRPHERLRATRRSGLGV